MIEAAQDQLQFMYPQTASIPNKMNISTLIQIG